MAADPSLTCGLIEFWLVEEPDPGSTKPPIDHVEGGAITSPPDGS